MFMLRLKHLYIKSMQIIMIKMTQYFDVYIIFQNEWDIDKGTIGLQLYSKVRPQHSELSQR